MDGVIWLENEPIKGSADAVKRLKQEGFKVGFVTNMSFLTVQEQEAKLKRAGIEAEGCVITSAMSAASTLKAGEKVLVSGGEGIHSAAISVGAEIVESENDNPDAVIVGMNPDFNNGHCKTAMRAVRAGARLIGTNHDPTYPTPEGLFPGGGAQLAAIAAAAETEPEITGKPNEAMARCVRQILGDVDLVVGDRPDSDGLFAKTLSADFGLVLSGVTKFADLPVDPKPGFIAENLAELVDEALKNNTQQK